MAPPALATSTDLATRLGRDLTSAETDQADALLADASAVVRAYLGQNITSDTVTITLAGTVEVRLELPSYPVTDVDTVLIDEEAVTDWTRIDHVLYREDGWYSDLSRLTPPQVTVTYTHGFAEVPGEISSVVVQMAMRSLVNPVGLRSEQAGSVQVTYAAETLGGVSMSEAEQRALRRWRRSAGMLTVGGAWWD